MTDRLPHDDGGAFPDPDWESLRETVWEPGQTPWSTWGQAHGGWMDQSGPASSPPEPVQPIPEARTPASPAPTAIATQDLDEPTAQIEVARVVAPTEIPVEATVAPTAVAPAIAVDDEPTQAPTRVRTTPTGSVPTTRSARAPSSPGPAHKVVPRPKAVHRASPERGIRPSQAPYRLGLARRIRSGFALILLSAVLAGLFAAVAVAVVAGIASAISSAAST